MPSPSPSPSSLPSPLPSYKMSSDNGTSNNQGQGDIRRHFAFGSSNTSNTSFNFNSQGPNMPNDHAHRGGDQDHNQHVSRYTPEQRRKFNQAKHAQITPASIGQVGFPNNNNGGLPSIVNKRTGQEINNTYMVDPSRDGMPERWFGSFQHAVGGQTMMRQFRELNPGSVDYRMMIVKQTNLERTIEDAGPAPVAVSVPLLPFNDNSSVTVSKRRKLLNIPDHCANCHKDGHVLGDCVWPYSKYYGDIYGCPICNTKDHCFDDCSNQRDLDDWGRFLILVLRRGGKCMIRSDYPIYTKAVEYLNTGKANNNLLMPWSRNVALMVQSQTFWVEKMKSWEYKPDIRTPFETDNNLTPDKLATIAEKDPGTFSHFKELRRAAEDKAKAKATATAGGEGEGEEATREADAGQPQPEDKPDDVAMGDGQVPEPHQPKPKKRKSAVPTAVQAPSEPRRKVPSTADQVNHSASQARQLLINNDKLDDTLM
ncbi:hypothetical protein F5Y13DRAFT_168961 [Hypoxylon sp. FL1857]|nr:hypothetical protein F5Y13DRAFT_168961 [Hypoxylon sp. FL1857]